MNICQVLISDGWGGAEASVYELARCLQDKGENVSLILNQEMVKYYADIENVSLLDIGALYPPKSIMPHIALEGMNNYFLRRAFWLFYLYLDEPLRQRHYKKVRGEVLQFLSRHNIQVIHAHRSPSIVLAIGLGKLSIPVVAQERGEHHLRGAAPVHLLARPAMNWIASRLARAISKADKVMVTSDYMLRAIEDWGVPLRSEPVVIPNCFNLSEIKKTRSTPTLKLKGRFNLLFPGGAKWTKGGDLLIPALAKVKEETTDIHLYIALDVPPGHLLRRMATELGLERNITFTGFLPIPEYRRLLHSVDLLVVPSRAETFGRVIVEAMALGKPVVAANAGALPELIENGRNGILVDLDPGQIAEAILHLYQNEPLRMKMGQNNLKDVVRFDSSSVVNQYIEFYLDTINDSQSKSRISS